MTNRSLNVRCGNDLCIGTIGMVMIRHKRQELERMEDVCVVGV